MKEYSLAKRTALLNAFLEKYNDSYKNYEMEMVRKNFCKSFGDYETQIYYAMDMLEDSENPYVYFTNLIEKLFGLNINILEIGCGVYPALGHEISKRQINGSITVYDPLLSKNVDIKNIKLYKKTFTGHENIDKFDLVIGKEPCAATFNIIHASNRFNKDLLLSPCNCYGLLPEFYDFSDNPIKQWYEYVEYNLGKHDTYYLDEQSNYKNPIYVKSR